MGYLLVGGALIANHQELRVRKARENLPREDLKEKLPALSSLPGPNEKNTWIIGLGAWLKEPHLYAIVDHRISIV